MVFDQPFENTHGHLQILSESETQSVFREWAQSDQCPCQGRKPRGQGLSSSWSVVFAGCCGVSLPSLLYAKISRGFGSPGELFVECERERGYQGILFLKPPPGGRGGALWPTRGGWDSKCGFCLVHSEGPSVIFVSVGNTALIKETRLPSCRTSLALWNARPPTRKYPKSKMVDVTLLTCLDYETCSPVAPPVFCGMIASWKWLPVIWQSGK